MDIHEISEFLLEAKKATYASSSAAKSQPSRPGSFDYRYERGQYRYHDCYFGTVKFIGEEAVYSGGESPVWAMNYYGYTLDDSLSEETMDNALRPALMLVGEDKNVLPLRGPKRYENGQYLYCFESNGDLHSFTGKEEIYKDGKLIYILHCHGGELK